MSLKSLRVYLKYARQHGGSFIAQRREENRRPILPAPFRPNPSSWRDDALTVAWLGHATVLMNVFGTWIVTDPALLSHVGPRIAGITVGPRRVTQPALTHNELPSLDAVLVSHAHMDHCDLATLRRLPRESHVVVPRGNRDLVSRFRETTELAWGDAVEIGGARIESIEVNHWGARKLTDRHRGYGGFLISKRGTRVVFGGDTAYTNAFSRLGRRFSHIDLAILPIGAYDPYIHAHSSPEQAWQMRGEMNATYILPMHHSTFRLSREPFDEPIKRLRHTARSDDWRIVITNAGETWSLAAEPAHLEAACTADSSSF